MFNRKGYSLVMWTAVFTVVTVAAAIFIVSIKRAITSKTLHTTDYLLWSLWDKGSVAQDEGGWNFQQIGAATGSTVHSLDQKVLEHKGKVRTILDATATTNPDPNIDYSTTSWQ